MEGDCVGAPTCQNSQGFIVFSRKDSTCIWPDLTDSLGKNTIPSSDHPFPTQIPFEILTDSYPLREWKEGEVVFGILLRWRPDLSEFTRFYSVFSKRFALYLA